MTTSRASCPFSDLVAPAPSVDPFLEAKLHRPRRRDNWVHRDRLVDALDRAVTHPVTLVAAPAGYGKTTALAQWLDRPDRPGHRLGLPGPRGQRSRPAVDPRRGGAGARRVRAARQRARPRGRRQQRHHAASRAAGHLNALAAAPDDIVLVLDDFHFIQAPACHEQVQFLIASLPAQAHLVIVTRSDPGLRLGRLRASGDLAEIRADDLSFTSARGDRAARQRRRAPARGDRLAADGAHRGLARGALPRDLVAGRPARPRRLRAEVQRRQPLHR